MNAAGSKRTAPGWRPGALAAIFFLALFGADEALAVVGRPATPASYAGVARRTSRRTTRRTVARQTAVTGAITTLPAGCATVAGPGGTVYRCGASYYRPAYDGPNLVYVVTTAP